MAPALVVDPDIKVDAFVVGRACKQVRTGKCKIVARQKASDICFQLITAFRREEHQLAPGCGGRLALAPLRAALRRPARWERNCTVRQEALGDLGRRMVTKKDAARRQADGDASRY